MIQQCRAVFASRSVPGTDAFRTFPGSDKFSIHVPNIELGEFCVDMFKISTFMMGQEVRVVHDTKANLVAYGNVVSP